MKFFYLILFMLFTLCACNDKDSPTPVPKPDPPKEIPKGFIDKIVLNSLVHSGDSLKISWSQLDTSDFGSYLVSRRDYAGGPMKPIKSISFKEQINYVDLSAPYSSYLEYQITGSLKTGATISSNIVNYSRPEVQFFDFWLYDVILNKEDQLLYFFDRHGIISIYDLKEKKTLKQIATGLDYNGYCDFGSFNGITELYLPTFDGRVVIYNARTLDKIDQVNIGLRANSVVFSNGNLYVSTDRYHPKPLKVYSRSSKALIAETGEFGVTRIKKIPNTNTELIEIASEVSPVDLNYYQFSEQGLFKASFDDIYHGDHPLNGWIFEVFPDGNRYITSFSGAIYNRNMTYQAGLPRGNLNFTCFGFDENNQIYAGCETKSIEVYSTTYVHVKSISTKGKPFKTFINGTKILCISAINDPSSDPQKEKITIEYFDK